MAAEWKKIPVHILLFISMAAWQAKAGENTVKYWCRKLYQYFGVNVGCVGRKAHWLSVCPLPCNHCELPWSSRALSTAEEAANTLPGFDGADLEDDLFCINFF